MPSADRVKEVASNKPAAATAFSLPGTAETGFVTFASVLSNGETCVYRASEQNGTLWEIGIGTFVTGSPNTITRPTTVLSNSAGTTAKIDFSGATGDVELVITVDASRLNDLEKMRTAGFFVRTNGTAQTTTDAAWNALHGGAGGALDTVEYDPKGYWSADSNGRFTPAAGRWQVGGCAGVDGLTSSQRLLVGVKKNGETTPSRLLARSGAPAATATVAMSGTTIVEANGTDYFQLCLFTDGAGTHVTLSTPGFLYFWGEYQGPVL